MAATGVNGLKVVLDLTLVLLVANLAVYTMMQKPDNN